MDGKTKIQMALKVRDANQDDKIKIDRNIKSVSHNIILSKKKKKK